MEDIIMEHDDLNAKLIYELMKIRQLREKEEHDNVIVPNKYFSWLNWFLNIDNQDSE